MKKILVFAVMAALIFCLSVNSFANEQGFLKYTYVKDGNTYFYPFKTSRCTPEQLDFMERFVSSDSNLIIYDGEYLKLVIIPKTADLYTFSFDFNGSPYCFVATEVCEVVIFRYLSPSSEPAYNRPEYFIPVTSSLSQLYNHVGYVGDPSKKENYSPGDLYARIGSLGLPGAFDELIVGGTYLNHKTPDSYTMKYSDFSFEGELVFEDDTGVFPEFVPEPPSDSDYSSIYKKSISDMASSVSQSSISFLPLLLILFSSFFLARMVIAVIHRFISY